MRLMKNVYKIHSLHSFYLKPKDDTELILFLITSRRFSSNSYYFKCTPEATSNDKIATGNENDHRYKKNN